MPRYRNTEMQVQNQEIFNLTKVDPWFIAQIEDLVKEEEILRSLSLNSIKKDYFLSVKKKGFSDRRLATLFKVDEKKVSEKRKKLGIKPVFKRVDSCAAEFESSTAYMYSTYEEECESNPSNNKKKGQQKPLIV